MLEIRNEGEAFAKEIRDVLETGQATKNVRLNPKPGFVKFNTTDVTDMIRKSWSLNKQLKLEEIPEEFSKEELTAIEIMTKPIYVRKGLKSHENLKTFKNAQLKPTRDVSTQNLKNLRNIDKAISEVRGIKAKSETPEIYDKQLADLALQRSSVQANVQTREAKNFTEFERFVETVGRPPSTREVQDLEIIQAMAKKPGFVTGAGVTSAAVTTFMMLPVFIDLAADFAQSWTEVPQDPNLKTADIADLRGLLTLEKARQWSAWLDNTLDYNLQKSIKNSEIYR